MRYEGLAATHSLNYPHDLRSDADKKPHGCYAGWVFLGFEGEDEQGEHVEVIVRVPCRRCHDELVAASAETL